MHITTDRQELGGPRCLFCSVAPRRQQRPNNRARTTTPSKRGPPQRQKRPRGRGPDAMQALRVGCPAGAVRLAARRPTRCSSSHSHAASETKTGSFSRSRGRRRAIHAQGDDGGVRCARCDCQLRLGIHADRARNPALAFGALDHPLIGSARRSRRAWTIVLAAEFCLRGPLPRRAPTAPTREREAGRGSDSDNDDDKYEAPIKHAHPLHNLDYHAIGEDRPSFRRRACAL